MWNFNIVNTSHIGDIFYLDRLLFYNIFGNLGIDEKWK